MKGLILSDIYSLRKQMLLSGSMALLYLIFGIMSDNAASMVIFLVLLATMIPVSSFTYNEQCKWDTYANTLPISRRSFVQAKYTLNLIFLILASVLGMAAIVISNIIHKNSIFSGAGLFGIAICVGLLYTGVFSALIFKMGVERSRILMIGTFLVPFIVILLVGKMDNFTSIISTVTDHMDIVGAAIGVIAVLTTMITYSLSVKIYSKKEL